MIEGAELDSSGSVALNVHRRQAGSEAGSAASIDSSLNKPPSL